MPFPTARYEARRGEVLLHMSHFFLRYLNGLYKSFDGDLALVIVLGEISHHNTAKFFSPDKLSNEAVLALQNRAADWTEMEGCNAFSLSCATGIPRETVRRKVAELKKRGWVKDVPTQGLRITPACAQHFGPDFSLNVLKEMLKTAHTIDGLLRSDPPAALSSPPARVKSVSKKPRRKRATGRRSNHEHNLQRHDQPQRPGGDRHRRRRGHRPGDR